MLVCFCTYELIQTEISACIFDNIWPYIAAYMAQFNAYIHVPESACIQRYIWTFSFSVHAHTGIYELKWQLIFACICLYVVCICLYVVMVTVALHSPRRPRGHCGTFAALSSVAARRQGIRWQIANCIWTRSVRPDNAVMAVAGSYRCYSVSIKGQPNQCRWCLYYPITT